MFTPQEEEKLREMARNSMPMTVTNPNHVTPAGRSSNESERSVAQHVNELFRRCGNTPPVVVAGPVDGPGQTTPVVEAPKDWKFEDKVRKFMKPGEHLLQFVSRTGLGRNQALQMNESEIGRFVAMAEKRNQDEWNPDRRGWSFTPEAI